MTTLLQERAVALAHQVYDASTRDLDDPAALNRLQSTIDQLQTVVDMLANAKDLTRQARARMC